ncbi:hypothetical protein K1F50_01605 [Muricauda oceani]|uniref:Uncharacterized protein n=1 Tax=Flagellimonas oceani TaxID=2698672 RepID=A0A6G7J213_9FLAO|nr:hypothetical protein [Allomuricauda oceani]MBW8241477.1 hypothetical protein [Allomuricauda oceani]QII44527.1 hypothetical protein GVT53_07505 [Allomuricauda oceani]
MEYWKVATAVITLVGFVFLVWKFAHYLQDRKEKKLKEMPVEDVSFDKILEEYNNVTPLQKKKFKSSYKGVKVKWHVSFYAIAETYQMGRVVKVMSFYERFLFVNFKTDLKKFPIIKSAKEGDKYIVTGLVDKVKGEKVYLKLIEIEKNKFFVI